MISTLGGEKGNKYKEFKFNFDKYFKYSYLWIKNIIKNEKNIFQIKLTILFSLNERIGHIFNLMQLWYFISIFLYFSLLKGIRILYNKSLENESINWVCYSYYVYSASTVHIENIQRWGVHEVHSLH